MIVVTGQIFTDPATLPDLFARLQQLCEPSRSEDGCTFYHMGVEDAEKGVLMAMEGWRDMDALQTHLAQPAIAKLLADFDGKFSNKVSIHEVSSTQPM
ncbi:putative quinol monooxygenase [Sphingobium sp. SCG-1]|uniref:putative quinol monooxygenase n=1 Tax=Sphingobium sp. SCG-1 TaxID=2072936 RepID=UPI001670158D|nr:antibiotic biosynthesis monooxygenase [Sphingobium sp. SCG-1]